MSRIKRMKRMKPNIIDRVVGYFDPVKGHQRAVARHVMALSYQGASRQGGAFSNWFASAKDADSDLLPDLPLLRSRSRDLCRNQPIALGAINTVVTNVVGRGLRMQSTIDAEYLGMEADDVNQWQRTTEREFKLWSQSTNCDLTRTQTFTQLQELVFRSALENGDAFSLLPMVAVDGFPYKTRIQIIESDRVSNKGSKPDSELLSGGIQFDSNGAPSHINVLKNHPGSVAGSNKNWSIIPVYGSGSFQRRNILHHFKKLRPGQSRGVPYLAPVIEPLKQLGRYSDAELMAAVVSGLFTVFVKTESGQGGLLGADDIVKSSSGDRQYDLGNGAIIEGMPGDEIEVINPGRPNQAFDPFVQAILRQVGVALEIPFELLIKHFTSSYTAARASIQEAWRFFRCRREWLVTSFCQPVYETWLAEAIAIGRIQAPGFFQDEAIRKAYTGTLWLGDGPISLDPLKEAKAVRERTDIGLTTLSEETAGYDGGDWEIKHVQQVKEKAARKEGGLIFESENPPVAPDDENSKSKQN